DHPDALAPRHIDPASHVNLFSDGAIMSLLHNSGFQPVAAWYFGMDAYEWLVQTAMGSGHHDLLDQLSPRIPALQTWFDRARLCDDIIVAAVPV
ncbi:MAG: hypothetical protein ACYTGH_19030, partial [Planctomycetota bacterium]